MTSTDRTPLRPTRQRTAVVEAMSSFDDFRSAQDLHDLLGRGGTPDEAAGAVYLFCIPESDYVSGQTLVCSGGLTGI